MAEKDRYLRITRKELPPVNHVLNFVSAYQEEIKKTLRLQDHNGIIKYSSNENIITDRGQALMDYLNNTPPKDSLCWGQTILSEIVAYELIKKSFAPQLAKSKLNIVLAPTSIDESINNDKEYQKGADFVIKANDDNRPLIGVDVTLGDSGLVRKKRRKPGFQKSSAMAVVVIPLKYIIVPKDNVPFIVFLNQIVTPQIIRNGKFLISDYYHYDGIDQWKNIFMERIGTAIAKCQNSLTTEDPRIVNYPYLTDVLLQLKRAKNIFLN